MKQHLMDGPFMLLAWGLVVLFLAALAGGGWLVFMRRGKRAEVDHKVYAEQKAVSMVQSREVAAAHHQMTMARMRKEIEATPHTVTDMEETADNYLGLGMRRRGD